MTEDDGHDNDDQEAVVIDLEKVAESLPYLISSLEFAALTYLTGGKQEGAGLALAAVEVHLADIDVPEHLREPIRALAVAMSDAIEGRATPLLKPANLGSGRRVAPLDDQYKKGVIAAMMELWMRSGEAKDVAARITARAVGHWTLNRKAANIEARTVMNWRKDCEEGEADKDQIGAYRQTLADVEAHGFDPAIAARNLVKRGGITADDIARSRLPKK